jgi:hypothetical protein
VLAVVLVVTADAILLGAVLVQELAIVI